MPHLRTGKRNQKGHNLMKWFTAKEASSSMTEALSIYKEAAGGAIGEALLQKANMPNFARWYKQGRTYTGKKLSKLLETEIPGTENIRIMPKEKAQQLSHSLGHSPEALGIFALPGGGVATPLYLKANKKLQDVVAPPKGRRGQLLEKAARAPRDYRREYDQYHAKPEHVQERLKRNQARRKLGLTKGDPREVDHKIPIKKGGSNARSNLRAVSLQENRKKFTKTAGLINVLDKKLLEAAQKDTRLGRFLAGAIPSVVSSTDKANQALLRGSAAGAAAALSKGGTSALTSGVGATNDTAKKLINAHKKVKNVTGKVKKKAGQVTSGVEDLQEHASVDSPYLDYLSRAAGYVGDIAGDVIDKVAGNPRIPRKPGQPANSDKHSDLFTDENPKGTIHGLGFKTPAHAQKSVAKIKGSGKTHAHKTQAAIAMEQRARSMGKSQAAGVYRKFIEEQKIKTQKKKSSHEKTAKKLTTKGRNRIAEGNFALPGRRYPIHDASHARNALSRVSQHGTPSEKQRVRRKVAQKYPGIDMAKEAFDPRITLYLLKKKKKATSPFMRRLYSSLADDSATLTDATVDAFNPTPKTRLGKIFKGVKSSAESVGQGTNPAMAATQAKLRFVADSGIGEGIQQAGASVAKGGKLMAENSTSLPKKVLGRALQGSGKATQAAGFWTANAPDALPGVLPI